MHFQTVILCLILSLASGFQEFVDEYSRDVLDEDLEYMENERGPERFVRKIRSVEEDYRNVETINTEEYFAEAPEDGRPKRRSKREIAGKRAEDLGEPLEVVVLDVASNRTDEGAANVTINDFIRFKRGADLKEDDKQRSKRERYNNSTDVREEVRPPNVHFVTQRRSESSPPPIYRTFDDYYRPQNSKRYDYDPYRNNYYPEHYESRHYEPPRYAKRRRIIYYATLPEDVRNPNDRYSYRESPYLSRGYVPLEPREPFGYRRSYLHPKPRYDGSVKTSYPLKVSADVNVREIKKNPERRIYSEVDGRYDHPFPYQEEYRL